VSNRTYFNGSGESKYIALLPRLLGGLEVAETVFIVVRVEPPLGHDTRRRCADLSSVLGKRLLLARVRGYLFSQKLHELVELLYLLLVLVLLRAGWWSGQEEGTEGEGNYIHWPLELANVDGDGGPSAIA
jgi:hypothetical protein